MKEFISPDELAKIKQFAKGPQTLEYKLSLFAKYTVEYEVPNARIPGRKDRRCRLGTFINKLFNTQLVLPAVGRRQQIGKAIKFAKEYLIEHPECAIYYAAAMGAAQEYREWMAAVGELQPEQQMAILDAEAEAEAQV
jgi:hypothetical protein